LPFLTVVVGNPKLGHQNMTKVDIPITTCGDGSYCCGPNNTRCCNEKIGYWVTNGLVRPTDKRSKISSPDELLLFEDSDDKNTANITAASDKSEKPDVSKLILDVGLGVGLGIGLPILLVLAVVVWLVIRRDRMQKSQTGTMGSSGKTMSDQPVSRSPG
jgi:hypothetical protein